MEDNNLANDRIDIYKNPDIKVTKGGNRERISVTLTGKSVDHTVANAIRLTICNYIPIYGFHRSNINVDSDYGKYMYNNDHIYIQLEQLPLFDIPNNFDVVNPLVFLSNNAMKEEYEEMIRDIDKGIVNVKNNTAAKNLSDIEISINKENDTDKYYFVSSHDIVLKIDGKVSDTYKKHGRICLFVLKPGERMSLSAVANLGIEKFSAIYEPCSTPASIEETPMSYRIEYETIGQLSNEVIFNKACVIIAKRLSLLRDFITDTYGDKYTGKDNEMIIDLYGVKHALGNVISATLNKTASVKCAGYYEKHPLYDYVTIHFYLEEKTKESPVVILNDVLTFLIKLFGEIKV
jgi:DNA-directed RNA polymerase subunit L